MGTAMRYAAQEAGRTADEAQRAAEEAERAAQTAEETAEAARMLEEAAQADRVLVMTDGKIELEGTPAEVFDHVEKMKEMLLSARADLCRHGR